MPHIRLVALGLALLVGTAAIASAQSAQTPPQTGKARQALGQRGRGLGVRNLRRGLFRGIQLSDAERTRLKAVREKYQPQFKSLRESLKPSGQAARAARQRGDTAAVRAEWQKTASQREEAQKLAEQVRAEYRNALTPENQAKFDANATQLKTRLATRADRLGKRAAANRGRRGKGPRA